MAQGWNTTGAPKAETGIAYATYGTRCINGIDAAVTCYFGTTDPSSGGTWGADTRGVIWVDGTNEKGGAGDDLGVVLKIYEKQGATPTYGFTSVRWRGYVAVSPNTSLLSATATSITAWNSMDVGGATGSDFALGVDLYVELQESNPGAGVKFEARKNGVTTDAHVVSLYPQVSGVSFGAVIHVEVDSSQVFQYRLLASGNTSASLTMALLAYYERY